MEQKHENGPAMQPNPDFLKRMKLYEDTIACKRVDKVLAAPMIIYLPMHLYPETSFQDVMMDWAKAEAPYIRYHQEYQPDLAWGPQAIFPIGAASKMDCKFLRWPGRDFEDPFMGFQVVDNEDGFMDPEEYLEYAEDPTGFVMRKILPRHYGALKGLEMLDLSNAIWQGGCYAMIPAAFPPVKAAFEAMSAAGEAMLHNAQAGGKICGMLAGMGWPSAIDYAASAPFDVFNDTLRGFLNTTMDMIEYPDELLAALKATTKIQVRTIKNQFKTQPFMKTVTFFIHNGMDNFMSREQYETFYWPGLKACIEAVLECGGVPHIYLEDNYLSKLDLFVRDLPAGKCIFTLIGTDMKKAKEKFAGKICISGGVSGTLLQYGTKEEVIKDVKNAIDILAPGGGYFLNCDVSLDVAKPENLHALFDTAASYIKY